MTEPNRSAADVLRGLTVEEKATLCLGGGFWSTAPLEAHGIEAIALNDGPHGLRKPPPEDSGIGAGSVPATCFPTAAALASSWDPGLLRRVGAAIGQEARAHDVAVVLGPGVNLKRTPLCGRNFEYFSEDPLLAGRLAAALVEGLQSQGVGAALKHFAANNSETERVRISADVDERTLRELYLAAFEHVVTTARPWTVMCAYNRIGGVPASQHRWLLTQVLRDEWGFDGLVMSDWGAVANRVAALEAGLDLEMPPNRGLSDAAIVAAVEDGTLEEGVLDTAAARVVQLVQRARGRQPATVDEAAHHTLAREAAAAGIVLLRNDGGVLPLADRAGLTVAVVGELARTPRIQGAGSSKVNPTRVDVPLDELTAALPSTTVRFAAGYPLADSPTADADADELASEAVAAVAGADVVVAFLGLPAAEESEGIDRDHLDLPAVQTDLLARVTAAHPALPVVVVLANGGVVVTRPWERHAAAVVECWLGGQALGGAVAAVLTGAVNPSGRLAETIPLRLEDTPSYLNRVGEELHVRYGEGVFVGYRGLDAVGGDVAYPFGHGLSYTTFAHRDLTVEVRGDAADPDLAASVTCSVANTGDRAGREVVQVYVGDPVAGVARPPRELKGFAAVDLAPGEEAAVTIGLDRRAFAFWSTRHRDWVVEPGTFTVAVGASSRDLRLETTVEVGGPPPRLPLTASSTVEEWLTHPEGAPALRAALGGPPDEPLGGAANEAHLIRMVGAFPLERMTAFGLGLTAERIIALAASVR